LGDTLETKIKKSKKETVKIEEPLDLNSLGLDKEIKKLPFYFDTKEKTPFLKIDSADLPKMKKMGWDWLTTDRTIDYRKSWSCWSGLREFVQNALDETNKVKLEYDFLSNTTYVLDNGKGFLAKHLLLGQTKGLTIREQATKRGHFGEGLKLGILPFFRKGSTVFIRTVGLDITFSMGPFDKHFVHYTFKKPNNHKKGTFIAISNFDGREYKRNFVQFLNKDEIVYKVPLTNEEFANEKNMLVLNTPGKLYVRDIFVQDQNANDWENAFFGYNFWFDDTSHVLDPDRSYIKTKSYLNNEFTKILACENEEFLTTFVKTISTPKEPNLKKVTSSFEFRHIDGKTLWMTDSQAKVLHKALQNVFGKEFTWSNSIDQAKALEHLKIIDLAGRFPDVTYTLHNRDLVKTADEWIALKDLNDVIYITNKDIEESFGKKSAKAFSKIIELLENFYKTYYPNGQVKVFWTVKPSDEVARVGGFYVPGSETISIKLDLLQNYAQLLQTVIHELSHHISGATDISEAFENGLTLSAYYFSEHFRKKPAALNKLLTLTFEMNKLDWKKLKIPFEDKNEFVDGL